MTAKQFVKQHKPTARSEKQKQNGPFGKAYWLIRELGAFMYFAEGTTESNAWVNAKKRIIEDQKQAENK